MLVPRQARTISYVPMPSSGLAPGYNICATKATESRADGSVVLTYSNYAAQTLLRVLQMGTNQWCWAYQYSATADVVQEALPSAVSSYIDRVGSGGGLSVTLNNNTGLLRLYQSDTATAYLTAESVQQGALGTPILLHQWFYTPHTPVPASSSSSSSSAVALPPTYFLAEQIDYPIDPTAGGSSSSSSGAAYQIITRYSYTWYAGGSRVQLRTTTLPAISAAQNGPGVAATRQEYYDTFGNLTYQMNERGFITRTAFDIPTGATSQRIDDVNTALVTDAPPGWVTPAGGGLQLTTDFTFDSEGRTTQALGPSHTVDINGTAWPMRRATWTIYQDGTSQQWTGQGYAMGSFPHYNYTLTNPVSITVMDKAGRVLQQIQATRAFTSGPLQATDSFPQTSYVRWTVNQYADGWHLSAQQAYKPLV